MDILQLFNKQNKSQNNKINKPYIIAEAGVNHECSLELAKRLIREAKEGGADAIKFQTYKAETIALKHSPYYWDLKKESTRSQYELFKKYDKFWKREFEELKKYSDRVKIEFMSTPFDTASVDFLDPLVKVFKISSSDITNRPFIEYICSINKPIILSTGASDISEIQEAVMWIEHFGNKLALLHCVLNYPTDDKNANLGMILDLKRLFPDKVIGYSDHTLPNDMKALEIATILGARILEKHFTFDKSLPGNDHYHAMDKEDLKLFKKNLKRDFELLGTLEKSPLVSEELARKNARRSLVARRRIPKGKRIDIDDITWKRPGNGISPKNIPLVLGQCALNDIEEDNIICFDMLSE